MMISFNEPSHSSPVGGAVTSGIRSRSERGKRVVERFVFMEVFE